ncbi:MAG: porin [Duodenibacillus sp.]|nr:porin [Duodenibacillus sp.]
MRKSLLAVAVLGAFAGSAMAADVTLYGKIDTGLMYTNTKVDGSKATNKFEMKSGITGGSRWGIKGSEDLGNGYKVGFMLESAIDSDTGKSETRLFHREASVNVAGPFGTVYAGRMGGVGGGSASSPISLWGMGSAFGTVWGNNALSTTLQSNASRYDNSIAYASPNFAGFQVIAFYSMGGDSVKNTDGKENSEDVDRYYGLGMKYVNGPIAMFGVVDQQNYRNFTKVDNLQGKRFTKNDDSLAVTLGGSYDFGVAKVYATAQYYDDLRTTETVSAPGLNLFGTSAKSATDSTKVKNIGAIKGWALSTSANVPVWGGNFKVGLGYADAESADKDAYGDREGKRYTGGVGYQYPLSKRTYLYAGANYMVDEIKNKDASTKTKTKTTQVFAGLQHNF